MRASSSCSRLSGARGVWRSCATLPIVDRSPLRLWTPVLTPADWSPHPCGLESSEEGSEAPAIGDPCPSDPETSFDGLPRGVKRARSTATIKGTRHGASAAGGRR